MTDNKYFVALGASSRDKGKTFLAPAASIKEAQQIVRDFIDENDLGAGCSPESDAFTGGELFYKDGKKQIGRISYNGRAWDLHNEELFHDYCF